MKIDILFLGGYTNIKLIRDSFYIPYFDYISKSSEHYLDIPTVFARTDKKYSIEQRIDMKEEYICVDEENFLESIKSFANSYNIRFASKDNFLGLYDTKDRLTLTAPNIGKQSLDLRIVTNVVAKNEDPRKDIDILYIIDNLENSEIDTFPFLNKIFNVIQNNSTIGIITNRLSYQERCKENFDTSSKIYLYNMKGQL